MSDQAPSLKRVHTADRSISPPPVKRRQQSTTTTKAVADFFKPSSQKPKPAEKTSWSVVKDSLLVGKHEAADAMPATEADQPRKIAIFDFVLSNQSGISLKSNNSKAPKADLKRLSDFKAKATSILTQLDLPICIYAATAKDEFRKPRTGMWRQLLDDRGLGDAPGTVDLEKSMFVGDAAGRSGSTTATKDFSCSDRDFAANVGIAFHTPEEYFLGEGPKPFVRDFDPTKFLGEVAGAATDAVPLLFSKKNPVDIVILCGSPGAGKSTFYWKHLKPLGYERINQDILKTRDKCLKVAADFLGESVPVAIGM
ncbi:putative dna kinase phosphatase pnk1 protein [Neofusicoccum parvum UCRNP2]|uniref:Putative dna kinase phosphatase pnk1 protein n=1 Tax=Botryosphaeria parva (strain UCR-NP2) TaxID=1287680 RepID=R1FWR6_BOTPV|nr:putative dna kinase phosphatase pnk1 protein [Neofusicoccum parvum UCRNP2]